MLYLYSFQFREYGIQTFAHILLYTCIAYLLCLISKYWLRWLHSTEIRDLKPVVLMLAGWICTNMVLRERRETPQTKSCIQNYCWATYCKFLAVKTMSSITILILNSGHCTFCYLLLFDNMLRMHGALNLRSIGWPLAIEKGKKEKRIIVCYLLLGKTVYKPAFWFCSDEVINRILTRCKMFSP